ncbi:MAG: NAD(P)-dependent oxidoreductase [Povalibacter sp.]
MSERPRLGFVGLGLMGAPMTRRLMSQGWDVTTWNREPERYAEVPGVQIAEGPAAVREASDIVFMCVLDAKAVEECCFGDRGFSKARTGATLLVDTSTINPDRTRAFADRLRHDAGMRWIDAPMSGGPPLAAKGGLTMMVGGADEDVAEAKAALEDLAGNLTHLGPVGAGQTAKIINQAIVGVSYMLMAEVLALSEGAGLPANSIPAALAGGLADSAALQRLYPQMAARDYANPKAYARQLDKDLLNVSAFIRECGLDLPLMEHAVQRYHSYAKDHPMQESAAVALMYEKGRR